MSAAWLAHLYTATGGVLAFLSTIDTIEGNYQRAFFWLYLQVAVDATDGLLARRLQVKERTPWFNGAKLDDIVDYLCYVFVPALMVWRAELVPAGWAIPVAAAILLSSAYGFNREDAKTSDHFFTGFPSYWNIVAFYLLIGGLPPAINAALLLLLAALVFVPIRYLYPSRGAELQRTTNALGLLWGFQMIAMLWQLPNVSRALLLSSLAFPLYYAVASVALDLRRRRAE
jgi:phosphatidylcholine synthase